MYNNYQTQNPFEAINRQLQAAQQNYAAIENNLKQQLNALNQQAKMFQNNYNTQQGQTPVNTPPTPEQQEIPPHIQQLTVLGEIKELLSKNNELMSNFISGTQSKECKCEVETPKSKPQKQESSQ